MLFEENYNGTMRCDEYDTGFGDFYEKSHWLKHKDFDLHHGKERDWLENIVNSG